ncbi:MAG: hypothetical protein M1834_002804 [Cirrosporium novae-zelandiae]|nr:MAG: hypothetical protein M1834_002804 [Cirrosporium novae-zelandiae]
MSTIEERRDSIGSEDSATELVSQGCYIFTPKAHEGARPAKRRKVAKAPKSQGQQDSAFPPLLRGAEKEDISALRYQIFQKEWSTQEARIKGLLELGNTTALKEILEFIHGSSPYSDNGKIPTGLVAAGPSISTHQRLFEQIAGEIRAEYKCPIAQIESAQCTNIKNVLKHIIRQTTNYNQEFGEDDEVDALIKGSSFLNYDLEILKVFVSQHQHDRVIIIFRDSESIDAGLVADLISLFSSWLDRIPFVLLFGIATSIDLFHEKLLRSTIRQMEGRAFEVESAEKALNSIFIATIRQELSGRMWLGPGLSNMLLERQRDHLQSPQAFTRSIQYAYLTHFFANPFSILISEETPPALLSREHCEAIRNLSSFRQFVKEQLDIKNVKLVRSLLNDDEALAKEAVTHISIGQKAINDLLRTVDLIIDIRSRMQPAENDDTALYIKALSGELADSPSIRELMLSLKRIESDTFSTLLTNLPPTLLSDSTISQIQNDLTTLLESTPSTKEARPLRTEQSAHHSTVTTTLINHKISLTKAPSTLTKQDTLYSSILTRFTTFFTTHLSHTLIKPRTLFMNEAFLYDAKSPHRDVFTPKPRFAIERALSAPHDYLNCDCCDGGDGNLSPTQPATAILYQLYLETGALINVFDLWSAFYAIIGGEDGEECEEQLAL